PPDGPPPLPQGPVVDPSFRRIDRLFDVRGVQTQQSDLRLVSYSRQIEPDLMIRSPVLPHLFERGEGLLLRHLEPGERARRPIPEIVGDRLVLEELVRFPPRPFGPTKRRVDVIHPWSGLGSFFAHSTKCPRSIRYFSSPA